MTHSKAISKILTSGMDPDEAKRFIQNTGDINQYMSEQMGGNFGMMNPTEAFAQQAEMGGFGSGSFDPKVSAQTAALMRSLE